MLSRAGFEQLLEVESAREPTVMLPGLTGEAEARGARAAVRTRMLIARLGNMVEIQADICASEREERGSQMRGGGWLDLLVYSRWLLYIQHSQKRLESGKLGIENMSFA